MGLSTSFVVPVGQDDGMPPADALTLFGPATREWFTTTFGTPTEAQAQAWASIGAGSNTLVIAPTGSGKTLAAFLWSLDRLASEPIPPPTRHRCRVVYVSPLKALAIDVERNLRVPLAGIRRVAEREGQTPPDITVGMRTGDTPANERRVFARSPQDILITTPESLFLLLTSAARESLRGVQTVIVDEVHAMCASKRGAHLALSLERLDALLPRPAQRIGLSATVRPREETARFLAGAAPVEVIAPQTPKTIEVRVEVPLADMTDLAPPRGEVDGQENPEASIWPAIEERVLDLIESHRSTIVFANGRRTVERLCARVNELAAARESTRAEDPNAKAAGVSRTPAEVMAQSRQSDGSAPSVARVHHGSVSREERAQTEEALKSGRLPAVIATSSLELGIDMGAVDLVVQIEAPLSVASGIQRVGRAGHSVHAISRGVMLPKHRGDLVSCAVIAERIIAGDIEESRFPRNPLDVLAQQIIAMVAMDSWHLSALADLIRRAAPFAQLPDSALRGVVDMLSGRYPSTAFASLRPRLVWDRQTDVITARPGAQRLAVTSGGTIPNRGLFGVFLTQGGSRVGELDEEMVYESRVGDVFLLGSTSWRIEDITPNRVLVSPAPGQPARMPFWHGDAMGRPAELGRAIGARLRALNAALDSPHPGGTRPTSQRGDVEHDQLAACGLDVLAIDNLLGYLREQREATGSCPDDRTIVVERFRDELGDWRLAIHCVLGARVNGPWALAIAGRISEVYGIDGQVLPGDDGIVIRLPDLTEAPRSAELVRFDPADIISIVEESVGGSALFAARFRECAARALLLPRGNPHRRQPLWQQRHRAAQLLDIAKKYPDFPITLETARECLQEVFDLSSLVDLMKGLTTGEIRLIEVETHRPSPFARSLLFGYIGAFLYEGDTPLAEHRATALALDPVLLAELLGRVEIRELLDPDIVANTALRLQWLDGERCPRDAEDIAEMLRVLGDLSTEEVLARGGDRQWLATLESAGRAIVVSIAGERRWLAVEDASRVRDALGASLPPGLPADHLEPVADPVADLLSRYARTHGPFTTQAVATRYGLGPAVAGHALARLAALRTVVAGAFTPQAHGRSEWCDAEVLRMLRRRCLAALRKEIEPVSPEAFARFLPLWQGLGSDTAGGVDGLLVAIEQLRGLPIAASALETLVLPARIRDYTPGYLDELCSAGDIVWAGAGRLPRGDGWVVLAPADIAPLLLPPIDATLVQGPVHTAILSALEGERALYFRALRQEIGERILAPTSESEVVSAIWDLVWGGFIATDTLAPLRATLDHARLRPRAPAARSRSRYRTSGRTVRRPGASTTPPTVAGRWYRLPSSPAQPTRRMAAIAEALMDRYGIVTSPTVAAEAVQGGFAPIYRVFSAMEERGSVRRGYFIEGLGAAQFGLASAIDQLRTVSTPRDSPEPHRFLDRVLVLAATDPANPYGATLPWPRRTEETGDGLVGTSHRPGRKAGALVVLVEGSLILYVERGGHSLLSHSDDSTVLTEASGALAEAVLAGSCGSLSLDRIDGNPVGASPLRAILCGSGFRSTPQGLRLGPSPR